MKKVTTIITLIAAMLVLSQCTKKMTGNTATSKTPAEEVTDIKAKYNDDQMKQGQVIFRSNCNKCHDFHEPQEFSVRKWDDVLPDMISKSELSKEQGALVRAWVISNARS